MSRAAVLTAVVLILASVSLSLVSAMEQRKIIKQERIESQYGWLGDMVGIGDRLYRITYQGGESELKIVSGGVLLKGTITEPPGTVWCSDGKTCSFSFRAKAPNLDRFTGGTGYAKHKFELYDDNGNVPMLAFLNGNPLIDTMVPISYGKLETFTFPNPLYSTGSNTQYYYFIKEYVQDIQTGTWIAGAISYSSESRFTIAVTPSVQSTPLPPPPPTTTIRVESTPQGAQVTSDGGMTTLGTTPFSMTMDAGQTKIITFSKSGYVSQVKGISSTSTSPFTVTLSPVVVVTSTPTPVPTYNLLANPTPVTTPATTTALPGTSSESTPAATTYPPSAGNSGTPAQDRQPAQGGGSEPVVYEQQPTVFTSANIFIALIVLIVIGAVYKLYELYVQKGKKAKRRK